MKDAIVVQQPSPGSTSPAKLLLLFHGVGSSAEDLLPLGKALAGRHPDAWVVNVRSPDPSSFGSGWQWFSVQGITEANRPARVQAAMPAFLKTMADWQQKSGATAASTTLIGFSQGAIMSLESTQQVPVPAARVISIAGRFAEAPTLAPAHARVHLLHGQQDNVMPISLAVEAQRGLQSLGTEVTLDRFPGLAHGIDQRVIDCIDRHLHSSLSEKST